MAQRLASGPSPSWDWSKAYARAGATSDGRFNAGTMRLPATTRLRWDSAAGDRVTLGPAEIEELVARIATSLQRMGVKRGDRVAGFLARRPASLATPLAVWRLGAIYVPLFTSLGVDALNVRLEDADIHTIVTDSANRAHLGEVQSQLPDLDVLVTDGGAVDGDATLVAEPGALSAAETMLDDPATIIFTSGTTARPKGCVMAQRSLLNLWPYIDHSLSLRSDGVFMSTADPGWTYGLFTSGVSPMAAGFDRLLYERGFDAEAWWSAIESWGVTHLAGAPTGFRQLAAAGREMIEGRNLKLEAATSAGEPLTPEVFSWFQENLGIAIHDSYGLTELGMVTAFLRVPGTPPARPGSMGVALPGFAIRLDIDGELVDGPGRGRIAVRDDGQLLSMGYWGREAEWKARLRDGWWVTEDVVRLDEEGLYWYVGRSDDVIVSAGYNISPNEVETVLLEHPLVIDAGCVGEPDTRKGHVVVAHVVLGGAQPPDLLDQLRKMVGSRLGWHAAPRRVEVHDAMPRTESGKIKRRDLKKPTA